MALTGEIGHPSSHAVAPAKINLALHVTGRRPDGYHDIDTLVMFADVGDILTAEPCETLTLDVSGRFSRHVPQGPDNLVLAAATALRNATGIKPETRLRLTKNLPPGAGIGGGSADAAAALILLNQTWKTGLNLADLMTIGRRLGADIPMCLHAQASGQSSEQKPGQSHSKALKASGTGDVIEPWPHAPSVPIVIAWPARTVTTGAVFSSLPSANNPPIPDLHSSAITTLSELISFLADTRNGLTEAACAIEPSIGEVLEAFRSRAECRISRMTGSGSACFGIFPTRIDAEAAARDIATDWPEWWVRAATAG